MSSELKTNKISPATGTALTLADHGDTLTLPSGGEIDIASGATLDVNGTIDATGATITGFPESGLTFITSATNNSEVSTWDFTNVFSADYDTYLLVIHSLFCATAQEVRLTIGNSSFSSKEDFNWYLHEWQTDGTGSYRNSGSSAVDYIDLNNTLNSSFPVTGFVWIFDPFSSTLKTRVNGQTTSARSSAYPNTHVVGAIGDGNPSSTSFQFSCGSGNVGSTSVTAKVSLLGLKESS